MSASTSTTSRERALSSKDAFNESDWQNSSEREAYVADYIRKNSDLPMVIFDQGFGAGSTKRIDGLCVDHNIEPAVADLRCERVFQKHPAHVHIEVSGSVNPDFKMQHYYHYHVKAEKIIQADRTGDEKLVALVYDKFQDVSGPVQRGGRFLAIPSAANRGNALDLSGTHADILKRYPEPAFADRGKTGIFAFKDPDGQVMIAIPPSSPWIISGPEFVNRVEQALRRGFFEEKLTPAQQAKDRAFHAAIDGNPAAKAKLNAEYMRQRAAITLPGGRTQWLGLDARGQLAKLGAMAQKDVVAQWRKDVDFPERPGQDRGR